MAYLADIRKNILANKSFDFSIRSVDLYKFLVKEKEFVISKQILRSGTAIGALITEAQNAESKKDFIHKLGISQKECSETIYWLHVLLKGNYINSAQFQSILVDTEELLKMLRSSIMTAKKIYSSSILRLGYGLQTLLIRKALQINQNPYKFEPRYS